MTSITAPSRVWQPTAATAAVCLVALFAVALMPEVCPAIGSIPPPDCGSDDRESAARVGAVAIVLAAALGIGLSYAVPSSRRIVTLTIAMIVVTLTGVVAIAAAVLASGFIVI